MKEFRVAIADDSLTIEFAQGRAIRFLRDHPHGRSVRVVLLEAEGDAEHMYLTGQPALELQQLAILAATLQMWTHKVHEEAADALE